MPLSADLTNPMDNEFQAFLGGLADEVEQLSINHAPSDRGNDRDSMIGSVKQEKSDVGANTSNTDKKVMMANAKEKQRAWSEFKKLDLTCSESDPSKVSFQLKSAKEKKKKKKKNNKSTKAKNQVDRENKEVMEKQTSSGGAPSSDTTISPVGLVSNIDEAYCRRPRWTLVIDTCCLIEDGGIHTHRIIDLANHATNAHAKAQTQQNMALVTTMVDEPIDIVIPSRVWSELDYQSKHNSVDSKNAYAARKVIRLLREELEAAIGGGRNPLCSEARVLRSQSLLEAQEAGSTFLSQDSQRWTNDDHILACALMENETMTRNARSVSGEAEAGGVAVVTLDNNLACKAYANGLKVYDSPAAFERHYRTRMASLRQRATGSLIESALRR